MPRPAGAAGSTAVAASALERCPTLAVELHPGARKSSKSSAGGLQRHRFGNHSIGSLPTAVDSRDNLNDVAEVTCARSDAGDDLSSESGLSLDTDSEYGTEARAAAAAAGGRGRQATGSVDDGLSRGGRSTLPPQCGEHQLPGLADLGLDLDSDTTSSEAPTQDLPRSTRSSERPPDDMVEEDDPAQGPPLLDLGGGMQLHGELPRIPPKTWLQAAGFEVPASGMGLDGEPVTASACERNNRYLDLFCRQVLTRQRASNLTSGALAYHDRALGCMRHSDPVPQHPCLGHQSSGMGVASSQDHLAQDGVWLERFIARARAAPLRGVAAGIVGHDVGEAVAEFLDALSDGSACGASVAAGDLPGGRRVAARKVVLRSVFQGRGRAGFCVDSDATVSTPGRSQSPPPPPLLLPESPPAPLILGDGQRLRPPAAGGPAGAP